MDPDATFEFRIATFNIRTGLAPDGAHNWFTRRGSTLATIRELGVEVLALQEVLWFQRHFLARVLPRYEVHGRGRARFCGGEAVPLLIDRSTFQVTSVRTRWFSATPERRGSRLPGATHPRVATTATLRSPGGVLCDVTNLHLDHRSDQRRAASIRLLLDWLDLTRPQILLGDFNASAGAASLRPLLESGFRLVRPQGAGGTFHGFSGDTSGPRIDHIFVNENLRVLDARVVARADLAPLPSDHWPVVATLALPAG